MEAAAEAQGEQALGERAGQRGFAVDGVDDEAAEAAGADRRRKGLEGRAGVVRPAQQPQRPATGVHGERRATADRDQLGARAP